MKYFQLHFLTLLLSISCFGQQHLSLKVDDAIQIGLEKSKGLHASLMKLQYADSKSSEAHTLLLPSLRFNGGYTRLSDIPPAQFSAPFLPTPITLSPTVVNNYTMRLTLQQPLFTGFKLQRNADIAEYNVQATQEEFAGD